MSNKDKSSTGEHEHDLAAATAAKSFGSSLDSIFGMDEPLPELSQKVEEKKRDVQNQSQELEALQQRLKATEQRLASIRGGAATSSHNHNGAPQHQQSSANEYTSLGSTHDRGAHDRGYNQGANLDADPAADNNVLTKRQDSFGQRLMPRTAPQANGQDDRASAARQV